MVPQGEAEFLWSVVRNPPVLLPVSIDSPVFPAVFSSNWTIGTAASNIKLQEDFENITLLLKK